MRQERTWEELCEIVRNAPYGFINYTAEEMIEHCEEIGEKNEGKPNYRGEPQVNVKERQLDFSIFEYMVDEVFEVGKVTVKRVGKERPDFDLKYLGQVDGQPKYERIDTGKTKGIFYLYRTEGVEAIDAFRIDRYGTEHPIQDRLYCTREEIIELAQKHSDIMEKRSEDVTVEFPTGEIHISNYFCEDRKNGFDELPSDIKYKDEYSINHSVGRMATAQWLAENRNMAYGQLGNTYACIYKVNDDKLVITSLWACTEDEDGYEIDIPVPEGWEKVGEVCCDVWRIELVDRKGLDDYGFDLEGYKKEMNHKEFSEVKVNPGTWEMKCYYQQRSDAEIMEEFGFPVWAELNRK